MKFSERRTFMHIPVVYGIRNCKTGEWYIGSTVDMNNRFMRHYSMLKHNSHHVKKLQEAFNVYGENSFHITILYKFKNGETPSEMHRKEGEYIQRFNSCSNGYNTIDNITNVHMPFLNNTDSVKLRIENSKIKIVAIDRFSGKVEHVFDSITNAANYYHGETTNISAVCKGKLRYCYDKVFVYLSDFNSEEDYRREHHAKGKPKSEEQRLKMSLSNKNSKPIYKYNTSNILVEEFHSRREAERKDGLPKEYLRRRLNLNINGYIYTETKI